MSLFKSSDDVVGTSLPAHQFHSLIKTVLSAFVELLMLFAMMLLLFVLLAVGSVL